MISIFDTLPLYKELLFAIIFLMKTDAIAQIVVKILVGQGSTDKTETNSRNSS
jgi:hypothetical protein